MAARSLHRLLGDAPDLARLADHAATLGRLQEVYAACVPTYLVETSRVANFKLETLVVHADNASVAAKLKQLEPRMRAEFARLGYPVAVLQFKIQPRRPEPLRMSSGRDAHLSEAARTSLFALTSDLPEDSPVRAALERMLANAG